MTLTFTKGHGTRNDFVLFADPDGRHDPSPQEVAGWCDRRAGIGGDGILRAVRSRHVAGHERWGDTWFMDYRNADGSLAEMCGNGLRVFAAFLLDQGLAEGDSLEIMTRAGLRRADRLAPGRFAVTMGPVVVDPEPIEVEVHARTWSAIPVDVGNPHAVCVLDDDEDLAALDLTHHPVWSPSARFPHGVNVEFVTVGGSGLRMRVHERGVGETWSCGTGVVAAVAATVGLPGPAPAARVAVPGGDLEVRGDAAQAILVGPAVLVADGVTRSEEAS